MPPRTSTSIRFNEKEEELLEAMRKKSGERSKSAVVKRSVAQSSFLQDHADDNGYVTIKLKDGTFIKFPVVAVGP